METKSAVLGAAGLLIAALSLSACSPATSATPPATPSAKSVTVAAEPTTPCAEEGSPGPCYWDASARDNHTGRSFYVDAAQVVHYKD